MCIASPTLASDMLCVWVNSWPLHVQPLRHTVRQTCHQAATEHTRIGPSHRGARFALGGAAGGRDLFSQVMCTLGARSTPVRRAATTERARRGSWHGLLARRCVPQAADKGGPCHRHNYLRGYPVTQEDIAFRLHSSDCLPLVRGGRHRFRSLYLVHVLEWHASCSLEVNQ